MPVPAQHLAQTLGGYGEMPVRLALRLGAVVAALQGGEERSQHRAQWMWFPSMQQLHLAFRRSRRVRCGVCTKKRLPNGIID